MPWELAKVDPPLIAASILPPFLAAQARIGRWVQPTKIVDGRTRPNPNPPRQKEIASVGVVSGNYSKTTWTNLVHARKEATALAKRYGTRAQKIKAANKDMYELLRGVPPADLLHFAVHGRYNPQNPGQESGIILTEGNSLPPTSKSPPIRVTPRDLGGFAPGCGAMAERPYRHCAQRRPRQMSWPLCRRTVAPASAP